MFISSGKLYSLWSSFKENDPYIYIKELTPLGIRSIELEASVAVSCMMLLCLSLCQCWPDWNEKGKVSRLMSIITEDRYVWIFHLSGIFCICFKCNLLLLVLDFLFISKYLKHLLLYLQVYCWHCLMKLMQWSFVLHICLNCGGGRV